MMKGIVIFFLAAMVAGHGYAQEARNYYIVVGAFAKSKQSFAEKFKNDLGVEAFVLEDKERRLLLVCLQEFHERKPSIDQMIATRKEGRFPEAWVRILAGEKIQTQIQPQTPPPALAEVKEPEEPVDNVNTQQPANIQQPIPNNQQPTKGPTTPQNTPVVFHMYDANDNSKVIEGNIEIVDTQRARLIQSSKSTDTVSLPNPNSDTGMLSFITDVFGYRKLQHEVSYKQPIVDSSKHYFDLEGDHYVASFEMVRYHKGDIATLYHVFFFNDAAIMMPESKYELNKLLDMMQSNSKYTIRLHGHTNGNARGRIVSMGPSKEFFSLNAPDVKEGSGSSRELSGQRAEVIKEWLVAQGIAADRIEVKAWGGKRMIHDKNGNNARRNVRVEVEVLSE